MTRFILVRHAQTEWNAVERFRGRVDLPIDDTGRGQAEVLAQRIVATWKPVALYTSPLVRAVQTADIIAGQVKLPVHTLDGLVDINYGDWQGLTPDEARERWPHAHHAWFNVPQIARIPGGETLEDIRTRAMTTIRELGERHEDQTIVAVSHNVVNRVVLLALLGVGIGHFWSIRQDPAAINVFDWHRTDPVLITLNDAAHLSGYGI